MGFFQGFSQWNATKYEKKVSEMESQGMCPDCSGKGFNTVANDYLYTTSYECHSCKGSGLFSVWSEID